MNTKTHHSYAEQFGRWLGGLWRGYRRAEQRFVRYLTTSVGLPLAAALALIWIARLVILGIALYVASGLAVVLLLLVLCAFVAGKGRSEPEPEDEPQWRVGLSGYGLYQGETPLNTREQDED